MAPEAPAAVSSLGSKLRDQSLGLPQRFRVLFSLRGVGTPEAADALLTGASRYSRAALRPSDAARSSRRTALDDPSALCRHEVAFALGQMQARPRLPHRARSPLTLRTQTPRAITALAAKLADDTEHSMVRHEAAEALGAIATPECMVLLERYALDKCREVAETCQLAVGRIRYWREERESTAKGSAVATKGSRKETFALAQTGAVLPCSAEDAAPDAESAFLSGARAAAPLWLAPPDALPPAHAAQWTLFRRRRRARLWRCSVRRCWMKPRQCLSAIVRSSPCATAAGQGRHHCSRSCWSPAAARY